MTGSHFLKRVCSLSSQTHHLGVGAPDLCEHGRGPLPGLAAAGPQRRPDGVLPEAAATGEGPPVRVLPAHGPAPRRRGGRVPPELPSSTSGRSPRWPSRGSARSQSSTPSLSLELNCSGRSLWTPSPIPRAQRTSRSSTQATRSDGTGSSPPPPSAWTRPVHPSSPAASTLTAASSKRMAPRVQTVPRSPCPMTQTWGWPMPTTRTCLCKSEFPSPTPSPSFLLLFLLSSRPSWST